MAHRPWTREETLVALNVYCRLPFGRLHARNPEVIEVATALGRTPSSLAMKCCNLAAFDPAQQARGISGLRKASQLDEQIWNEFTADPESLSFEAEQALSTLTHQEMHLAETVEWEDVHGLDRVAMTKVRVNQHFFRAMILASYHTQCAVCELPFQSLLVASHIIPWAIDKSQRMNPCNGLCLCTLHDKAFDRGLLRIAPDLSVTLHDEVIAVGNLPSVQDSFIKYHGKSITLPDRWHPDSEFLVRRNSLHSTAT